MIITIPKGDHRRVEELLSLLSPDLIYLLRTIKLVEGGSTRQASVLRGLETCDTHPDIVLIHDGARPWIGAGTIVNVLQTTATYGACIPVVPSVDAMKQINSNGIIRAHLGRTETVCAQTPQGFRYDDILQAHHRAASDGTYYIDDSEIYSRYIGEVHTVDGERENRKITFLSDFETDREGEK